MRLVVSETKPTELMPALGACHVHTAMVLLYWFLALWTLLGVNLDPVTSVSLSSFAYTILPLLK